MREEGLLNGISRRSAKVSLLRHSGWLFKLGKRQDCVDGVDDQLLRPPPPSVRAFHHDTPQPGMRPCMYSDTAQKLS